MRVGGVEDPGLGQVAQVLLVFLDLLVAARQVQRDLGHVVDIGVADVRHFQSGGFDAPLEVGEHRVGAAGRPDAHIPDADLPGERQVLVVEVAGYLQRNLDSGESGSRGRLAARTRDRKAAPPNRVRAKSRRLLIGRSLLERQLYQER